MWGHSEALLTRLTQMESELSAIKLEIKEWETVQIDPVPALTEQIRELHHRFFASRQTACPSPGPAAYRRAESSQ